MKWHISHSWPPVSEKILVYLSGELITVRDGTLKKIWRDGFQGAETFFTNAMIYCSGPSPAPPNRIIGSAGPTTTARMEPFFPDFVRVGVRGLLGKGDLSSFGKELLQKARIPYGMAFGGAGALLSEKILAAECIAFPELGPEAVFRLVVQDFPVVFIPEYAGFSSESRE